MKRFVIMTVGKTHSGKTTFAKALEHTMPNTLVIDQDNHAEFINANYKALLPKHGPNAIKYAITDTIAVNQTELHLILCNSNRNPKGRKNMLDKFHSKGFTSILVHFDLPDQILIDRIAESQRSRTIFRTASSFEEVLARQDAESLAGRVSDPLADEAHYLFVIKNPAEGPHVIQNIIELGKQNEGEPRNG